jgi:lipopolysaccharide/colanic/teichoic acid biosynthesis glycosyltransferase
VGPLAERAKRALDIAGATAGLVVAAPVLGIAALLIKAEDRGPVLFRQTRVGRGGRDFEVLKLRTMVVDAERQGAGYAVGDRDPRITRVGDGLRRTSLDELPQLWNVLRGDMSLVGPRPTLRYQVEQYTDRQRRRLAVRPGLTGWAQVHGRTALPWSERIELDVWYVDNRSLALDLRILARTVGVLLRGEGVYKGATGGWDGAPPA